MGKYIETTCDKWDGKGRLIKQPLVIRRVTDVKGQIHEHVASADMTNCDACHGVGKVRKRVTS